MVKTVFEWTFYVSVSSVSCPRELDMCLMRGTEDLAECRFVGCIFFM